MEKVTLKRLSICPCGETVLDDSIKLGTEYMIDHAPIPDMKYGCGFCGRVQIGVKMVMANQIIHPDWPMAPLPLSLFTDEMLPVDGIVHYTP